MTQIPAVQIHGVDDDRVDKVDPPPCGPDYVVVKVAACGICGSDLGYIAQGGLTPPGIPMPLGHELYGHVHEVGANVKGVQQGQFVTVNPMANEQGIGNGGNAGGFAPYIHVENDANKPDVLMALPDEISAEQGALIEPLAVAMHSVNQSRIEPGQSVLVLGAGPIGLGAVIALRYMGVKDIVVADMSASRLAIAEQLGASVTCKVDEADLAETLFKHHGSAELLGIPLPGTDVYIEATGVGAVLQQAIELARPRARVVVVAVHKGNIELNPVNLMMKELELVGSMAYPDEFPQVVAMLLSGKVDVSPMVSHRYELDAFLNALNVARDPEQAAKVMICVN